MADGENEHDAATFGQLKKVATKVDNNATNISNLQTALGTYDKTTAGNIDTGASAKANISKLDAKLGADSDIKNTNYVNKANSVKANLSALDGQVKNNTDAIGTVSELSGIKNVNGDPVFDTDATVNLSSALKAVDGKVGDLATGTYNIITSGQTVNANLTKLDTALGAYSDADAKNIDKEGSAKANISALDTALGIYSDDEAQNIDKEASAKENISALDKAIGITENGAYVINGNSIGANLNALDNQVLTNTKAIARVNAKVNKVGAGAAALAALHPLDYDPNDKLTFAAGYGNYMGENAIALGAFYRPNEDVMFSVAGNMGNGENMVNAGVSFALGSGSKTTTGRAAMAQKIESLSNENDALRSELQAQKNHSEEQDREIAELKAMVQSLAAK